MIHKRGRKAIIFLHYYIIRVHEKELKRFATCIVGTFILLKYAIWRRKRHIQNIHFYAYNMHILCILCTTVADSVTLNLWTKNVRLVTYFPTAPERKNNAEKSSLAIISSQRLWRKAYRFSAQAFRAKQAAFRAQKKAKSTHIVNSYLHIWPCNLIHR